MSSEGAGVTLPASLLGPVQLPPCPIGSPVSMNILGNLTHSAVSPKIERARRRNLRRSK